MKSLFMTAMSLAVTAIGGAAHAQVVITSGPAAGTTGASGLSGQFYFTNAAPVTTINMAQIYFATHAATGTFTASEAGITGSANGFGYFAHDSDSAAEFLQVGDDGKSYVGPTTTLDDGLFDFKGYIDITAPGTVPFYTYSDDGSAIFIGGQQIISNDGVHVETRVDGSATFAQAGIYPLEVVYFNHVTPGFANTGGLQAGFGGAQLLQLASAPEPSGAAAIALGLLGIAALTLRARRRSGINPC